MGLPEVEMIYYFWKKVLCPVIYSLSTYVNSSEIQVNLAFGSVVKKKKIGMNSEEKKNV